MTRAPGSQPLEDYGYIPRAAVREDVLPKNDKQTRCSRKGLASYFTLDVAGKTSPDVAGGYPQPRDATEEIADHVALWRA